MRGPAGVGNDSPRAVMDSFDHLKRADQRTKSGTNAPEGLRSNHVV